MPLNDGAYGHEVQELSLINNVAEWEIDDRIWIQKRMEFDLPDLQKHQKRNNFKGSAA